MSVKKKLTNLRILCCHNHTKTIATIVLIYNLVLLSFHDVSSNPVYTTASPAFKENVGVNQHQSNPTDIFPNTLLNNVSQSDSPRNLDSFNHNNARRFAKQDKPKQLLQTNKFSPQPNPDMNTNTRLSERVPSQLNHASLPRDFFNNNKYYNDTESESIVEGSGNGPVSASKHQTDKFDDTEDGGDDEDDYDYSDIGSGQSNEFPTTQRKPETYGNNDQLNKPNELDVYNPFRPPSLNTLYSNATNQSPTKLPKVKPVTVFPIAANSTSMLSDFSLPSVSAGIPFPSQKQPTSEILIPSTLNSSTSHREFPNHQINTTTRFETSEKPIQSLPTVENNSFVSTSPILTNPSSNIDILKIDKESKPSSYNNNNQSTMNQASKTHDNEYDYEEENDEDDSDEASNFEDNLSQDNDNSIKMTTTTPTKISTVTMRPYQTNSLASASEAIKTTPIPMVVPSYTNTAQSDMYPTGVTQNTQSNFNSNPKLTKPTFTTATSVELTTVSPVDDLDDDEEEDDDKDDEFTDDELEEDDLDPHSTLSQSHKNVPQQNNSMNLWTTTTTKLPHSNAPTIHSHENEPLKINSTSSFLIPVNPTTASIYHPVEYLETNSPLETAKTILPSLSTNHGSTTPMPITSNSTNQTTTTITTSTTTTTTTTTVRQTANMPFYTYMTTTRSPTIKYVSTPKSRVTTVVTKASEIPAYDRSLQDDDLGLTKQIYDKAVEAYEVTNKAFHATLSAVWPPNMDLNSNTFDPLLAQPLLFMCKYCQRNSITSKLQFTY